MQPPRWLYHLSTFCILATVGLRAEQVRVGNSQEFRTAIRRLAPGTTLLLAPGAYRGGVDLRNVAGTEHAPIVIRGADPKRPPVFAGGNEALHLSDCNYVTLSHLKVTGFPANGINIDDAGTYDTPSHHIVCEDLTIEATGPRGNHDALKLSGVDHVTVRRCRFAGWGGSAIDMVGCHHGVVQDCRFVGRDGFSQSSGVQIKGGSTHILVERCLFDRAGQRAVNLGGSTGLRYFRPRVGDYEASDVTIAGNRFIGSLSPVAWVTAHGGHVHHNTIVLPKKWVLRILQETKDPKFKPCHGGVFENNLIVFDRNVRTFVNVGPRTAPHTFVFRRNAWYQVDGRRRPSLPTREIGAVYQVNPELERIGQPDMRTGSRDRRFRDIGADAYPITLRYPVAR